MATREISGRTFKSRKVLGREVWVHKTERREYTLAYVESDSVGNSLGWYFNVKGDGLHTIGHDSRSSRYTTNFYPTAEAALAVALSV